jgi:uncharacterized membrane protein YjgN (DUF898 family)
MQTLSSTMGDGPLQAQPLDITFDGQGGRMIGLGFINGVLKVLTLGLYSFWGKTEIRRRIWSATRLNGEPVNYTGTGKELFLGFLIIFGAVLLPVLLIGTALIMMFGPRAASIFQALLYLMFFMVVGNAIYRAQRYRLSRTEWRGIRGGLVGSPGRYGWTYFWTLAGPFVAIAVFAAVIAWATGPTVGSVIMLLGFLALMWVLPWRANKLQADLTNDMRFGDRPLTYSGTSRPLYKRYLFAWLGNSVFFAAALAATGLYMMQDDRYLSWFVLKIPPTLPDILVIVGIWVLTLIASAVVTSWYRASQMNHFAGHTHFEGATFRGEATGRSLMWLVLSNWLISIAGLLVAVLIGGLLIYTVGPIAPQLGQQAAGAVDTTGPDKTGGLLSLMLVVPPIIILTTLTATFAQFRSARYFLSRLKLDGPVNLGAILQGQHQSPARGEGLAQVFDIDAF